VVSTLPPATLVIACNTGMHSSAPVATDLTARLCDSWEATVKVLAATPVPCVYTSFTGE
jgi:hypothetical protein